MSPVSKKIISQEQAIQLRNSWRESGESVVFTNGCFDIIHLGHLDYLEKARAKGDKLIVGLNTDLSIRQIKGPDRPVQDQKSRAMLLASMEFVDAVIMFEEETPEKLINLILPDILVKGSDYEISNIVGAKTVIEHGGKVETLELVKGYSTTNIIKKIKGI